MPSERVQRQIDALLDEAAAAIRAEDWETVAARCRAVLALDEANEDAPGYLSAAEVQIGASSGPSSSSPPPPLSPGPSHPDSFAGGRYRVERFLGEGGKKRVFLAHDTTLDRDVAFGQFRTEGMDAAGRARVTQEAQAMGRVGAHPNLVAIYDIGEESGAPFIVQEYVSGGSLADLVGEEPPPLEQTLRLASDVCAALEFIHVCSAIIPSGGLPLVLVGQTAEDRPADDTASAGDGTCSRWPDGWLEIERLMRSGLVVVPNELAEQVPQMPLVHDDHVVEALASQRPDQSLGDRVGLR